MSRGDHRIATRVIRQRQHIDLRVLRRLVGKLNQRLATMLLNHTTARDQLGSDHKRVRRVQHVSQRRDSFGRDLCYSTPIAAATSGEAVPA